MANDNVRNLVERAFDREAMEEALLEEIRGRIDYCDIAETVADEYEEYIQEAIEEAARNVLESILPF